MNYSIRSVNRKIEDISGQRLRQKNRVKIFLVSTMVALIISAVLIGISMGTGAFFQILKNSPSINDLDSVSPAASKSIVYAADGSVMQELIQQGSNRESVTYDKLPINLVRAFVSIEDARFYTHDGVDVKGIFRALFVGLSSGKLSEGASTLTQQLIKNNIFNGGMETNFGDRIERKLQEQYLALRVEKELDKETILNYYLNTINLGSNCLGVQVASERYFGKDVSDLDLSECTVLAAITQNPSKYNPITHPENNQKRRLIVLKYMLENGYISETDYKSASSDDVYTHIQQTASQYSGRHAFSYFTDTVFEDILEKLQTELGYTDTQAYNLLYSGGLRIYTTMDPEIQNIVDEEVNRESNYIVKEKRKEHEYLEYALVYRLCIRLKNGHEYYYDESNIRNYHLDTLHDPKFRLTFDTEEELQATAEDYRNHILNLTKGELVYETITATIEPQTSAIVIDQSNGHVLAVTGGRGNKDELGSLTLNRATDSLRQPGSTFKIISAFAPALDKKGKTLASTYYDEPLIYGDKTISNWWGDQHMGYTSIDFAIMASMNVAAVKCVEETVTENTAYDYAQSFGITSLIPADKSPVFTIGGLTYGVSNLEMTGAYSAIANNGVYIKPVFWTKVTDADGNLVLENVPESHTVLKKETAQLLTHAMYQSVYPPFGIWNEYGVGSTSAACKVKNMDVAGKSGTTNDANDIWFIGYSPYVTLGVWSGYDSAKTFGDSPGYHKKIWQKIMQRISDTQTTRYFDYTGLVKATICSKSGLLAREGVCDACGDENCHIYKEYFTPDTVPTEYCNRHLVYKICKESGELATEYCPEDQIIEKVYLSIDPQDNNGYETADTRYTAPEELAGSSCKKHGKKK